MNQLLYLVAAALVIAWVIGVVGFSATGMIHVLLVIAAIAVLLNVIRGRGVRV